MRTGGQQYIPRPEQWRDGAPAPWPVPGRAMSVDEVLHGVRRRIYTGSVEPGFDDARPSAVLAVLADGSDGAEVLLTRRAMHLRNHRGEVSFPGGRLDEGETHEQAALREANEEVGLPLDAVEVIGRLDPIGTPVSRSWIVPVVARIERPLPLVGHPGEVDRVLWVPLHDLTSPGTYREELWDTSPARGAVLFFHLDDETVWGATARILHRLLRAAHGIDGHEPPLLTVQR